MFLLTYKKTILKKSETYDESEKDESKKRNQSRKADESGEIDQSGEKNQSGEKAQSREKNQNGKIDLSGKTDQSEKKDQSRKIDPNVIRKREMFHGFNLHRCRASAENKLINVSGYSIILIYLYDQLLTYIGLFYIIINILIVYAMPHGLI